MSKKSKKSGKPSTSNPQKADDWTGFFEELQKETPRGGILVGAAFLDEHLRQLIAAFLIDKDKSIKIDNKPVVERFLDGGDTAPLGSFAARTQAAYCLGLISEEEFADLNIIRGIRNQFAHSLHGLSIRDKWVSDECEKLAHPQKAGLSTKLSPGDSLLIAIALLASRIKIRALDIEVKKERREVKSNVKVVEHIKVGLP